jgi:hypothetical protein
MGSPSLSSTLAPFGTVTTSLNRVYSVGLITAWDVTFPTSSGNVGLLSAQYVGATTIPLLVVEKVKGVGAETQALTFSCGSTIASSSRFYLGLNNDVTGAISYDSSVNGLTNMAASIKANLQKLPGVSFVSVTAGAFTSGKSYTFNVAFLNVAYAPDLLSLDPPLCSSGSPTSTVSRVAVGGISTIGGNLRLTASGNSSSLLVPVSSSAADMAVAAE